MVAGRRYRGSTKESNVKRGSFDCRHQAGTSHGREGLAAAKIAHSTGTVEALFGVGENGEIGTQEQSLLSPRVAHAIRHAADRYAFGQIAAEEIDKLSFVGVPANTNCALRTLRRMLHKAEEWKLVRHVVKIKLVTEYGRTVRLDDEAEEKLLAAAERLVGKGDWNPKLRLLFRDIIMLVRDTRMRNERELYCMRIENINWNNLVIFVPDSKTPDGRRLVPMSERVIALLRARCGSRREGWVFPSKRSRAGHLTTMARRFREARREAGLPQTLVLYCGRHAGSETHGKPGGRDEDDGAQGCKDGYVVSAPGTGNSARRAERVWFGSRIGAYVAEKTYGTFYGTAP